MRSYRRVGAKGTLDLQYVLWPRQDEGRSPLLFAVSVPLTTYAESADLATIPAQAAKALRPTSPMRLCDPAWSHPIAHGWVWLFADGLDGWLPATRPSIHLSPKQRLIQREAGGIELLYQDIAMNSLIRAKKP